MRVLGRTISKKDLAWKNGQTVLSTVGNTRKERSTEKALSYGSMDQPLEANSTKIISTGMVHTHGTMERSTKVIG